MNENRVPTVTKPKLLDKRFTILLVLQLIILLAIALLVVSNRLSRGQVDSAAERQVANQLQAAGLVTPAIDSYKRYFYRASLTAGEKASIAFSIGGLYESQALYEQALSWYYMVSAVDPNSRHKEEADKKVVSILEKLGKVTASKRALKEATALGAEAKPAKGSTVIARIGSKDIYQHDLDQAIDRLPGSLQDEFKSKEGKVKLLEKIMAEEILSQKGLRLGLDQTPEFVKKMEDVRRELLAQRVLQDEMKKEMAVDPADVHNYYTANQEQYVRKERAEVSLLKVKSKKTAEQILKKLIAGKKFVDLVKAYSEDKASKANNGKFAGLVMKDTPFLSYSAEVANQILAKKPKQWTKPILAGGIYTIFYIRSHEKESRPTFEQVKNRVEFDYRQGKMRQRYQELIDTALKGDDVSIFRERIK